jgi:hypothetical protein
MKRAFTILSAAMLAAASLDLAALHAASRGSPRPPTAHSATPAAPAPQAVRSLTAALVPDTPVQVSFSAEAASLVDLSPEERAEQYRDWLLFAATSSVVTSADQFGRIFFDLPSIRSGYMRSIGTFEFGPTRSRFIGDGIVLALVPAASEAAQRRDELARIADQQRKNLGGDFKQLLVFEYTLDPDRGGARLTRRPGADASYARLFSPEFGYHEQALASLDDMRQFMRTIDDLTFAHKTSSAITVGGRKFARPHGTIGVEQVATVWQAERAIQKNLAEWEAFVHEQEAAFNAKWEGRRYFGEAERQNLEDQRKQELVVVQKRIDEEQARRKPIGGSGFSLDPQVDFPTLRKHFDALRPNLAKWVGGDVGEIDADKVSAALGARNIVPYAQFKGQLSRSSSPLAMLAAALLSQMQLDDSFQAARYDGSLQGTDVGMTLFYTDLIAKLWTIDYVHSSPSHRVMPDFADHPAAATKMSLLYGPENDKLSAARLWFGPRVQGYQIADDGSTLLFAHNATRIFSAGHDPEHPDAETQTGPLLGYPIDWWNDHYEQVAAHEPQYQRLNEIMKWSALIGWLNGKADGDRLGYLAGIAVDHSQVFKTWAQRHRELRFTHWSNIDFKPAGYKGATTEALPLLSGPITAGGVSLADRSLGKQAPLSRDFDALTRRSSISYAESNGTNMVQMADHTVFRFDADSHGMFKVVAKARPEIELRTMAAQLKSAEVERIVAANKDGEVLLETRFDQAPLGDLAIDRGRNGFAIGWQSRAIEQAQTMARDLSKAADADAALLGNPAVESVIRLDELNYAVKLKASPEWIRFAPQAKPSVSIDPAWQLRAAAPDDEAKAVLQARVLSEAQLVDELRQKPGRLVIETDDEDHAIVNWATDAPTTDARSVTLQTSRGPVKAWVDQRGRTVELRAGGDQLSDVLVVARALHPRELAAIREAAASGESKALRIDLPVSESPFGQAVARHDFRAAARLIAEDPATARREIGRGIAEDVLRNREIEASRGINEALREIDQRIATRGPAPELLVRRALLQIERGSVAEAVDTAAAPWARPLDDQAALLDEARALWARGGEDARRYYEFAAASNRAAREAGHAPGTFSAYMHDGHLDFDFILAKADKSIPIDHADQIDRAADSVVYHTEGASLNKVDWSAPAHDALAQVIDGHLGKVIRLSDESVATYRPAKIWTPDRKLSFKPARPRTATDGVRPMLSSGSCSAPPSKATPDGRDAPARDEGCANGIGEGRGADVYLVVAGSDA